MIHLLQLQTLFPLVHDGYLIKDTFRAPSLSFGLKEQRARQEQLRGHGNRSWTCHGKASTRYSLVRQHVRAHFLWGLQFSPPAYMQSPRHRGRNQR